MWCLCCPQVPQLSGSLPPPSALWGSEQTKMAGLNHHLVFLGSHRLHEGMPFDMGGNNSISGNSRWGEVRLNKAAGAFPKGVPHSTEKIFWQLKYRDWTIAQTALYSPKSQENGEFGKYGIMQVENALCCDQVPINMFHLRPRFWVMWYIINRCCQNFCLLTWKLAEAGGFWKSTGSGV